MKETKPRPLLRTVTEFRRGILGKRSSMNMCYMVCAPLESYLRTLGWETELVSGKVSGKEHYWLRLLDGRIIDPTADQFFPEEGDKMMPKVYIGDQPRELV